MGRAWLSHPRNKACIFDERAEGLGCSRSARHRPRNGQSFLAPSATSSIRRLNWLQAPEVAQKKSFFNNWCAKDAAFFFKEWNGGVHRGGIRGENWVDLEVATDVEWLSHESSYAGSRANVVAYGTPHSNELLAAVADEIAVWAEPEMVRVGERTIRGQKLGLIAVVPFPGGMSRYLGVHSGTSPDATTSGAHLNWQLLPDYLVYDNDRVREWGFFDNHWQAVPAGEG